MSLRRPSCSYECTCACVRASVRASVRACVHVSVFGGGSLHCIINRLRAMKNYIFVSGLLNIVFPSLETIELVYFNLRSCSELMA